MTDLKALDLHFANLVSQDDKIRYPSFKTVLEITEERVDWIYDKWDVLVNKLSSDNSFQRSIGMMLIANLCKSDSEGRICEIIDRLLALTEDEKFITSRLCLQNIWKTAVQHSDLTKKVSKFLESTYFGNKHLNSHANLIKQDVFSSLANIYKHTKNADTLTAMNDIYDTETDEKVKKVLKKMMK
ncbi:MAG TPA: hypothetical protein VIH57_23065 [Bacteroidales bacterium]